MDDLELKWWTHEMSVDNVALDDDHKAFFELAKIIVDIDVTAKSTVLESCLIMLEEYVAGHFLREEKALKAVNYPHLEMHVQKHTTFKNHILKFIKNYNEGIFDGLDDLPSLVTSWLVQHIMHEDMRYKYWIKDKLVDNRPLAYLAVDANDITPKST